MGFLIYSNMEKLTIDHLIPYSNYKLGLMDLSSLGHIPTTMTLEGFDLHLKDKPLIAERTNWSLDEIKPILHPLSDLKKVIEINGKLTTRMLVLEEIDVEMLWGEIRARLNDKLVLSIPYLITQKLFEWHFDVFGLIPKGLAININTLKEKL